MRDTGLYAAPTPEIGTVIFGPDARAGDKMPLDQHCCTLIMDDGSKLTLRFDGQRQVPSRRTISGSPAGL